jgi:hypothetical protein
MALTRWLRVALGGLTAGRPAPLPALPRLVLIAPYMRDAQLWCWDNGLHPREVYIVTTADRLRGLGGPLEIVWLNDHRWPNWAEHDRIAEYVAMLRYRGNVQIERQDHT